MFIFSFHYSIKLCSFIIKTKSKRTYPDTSITIWRVFGGTTGLDPIYMLYIL